MMRWQMPDETPFIILLIGLIIVMIVFAFGAIGDNDEPRPIQPATEGTIAPATEGTCE